jgi:hypothetical protein
VDTIATSLPIVKFSQDFEIVPGSKLNDAYQSGPQLIHPSSNPESLLGDRADQPILGNATDPLTQPANPLTRTANLVDLPGAENDTLSTAIAVNLSPRENTIEWAGMIGDIGHSDPDKDVDMIAVSLQAGDRLILDLDADEGGSTLDAGLRIFDADGNPLAFSDDDPAPGEWWSFDPYLEFEASQSGTYYVGISGYENYFYNPMVSGSGVNGSTGDYTLSMTLEAFAAEPTDIMTQAMATGLSSDTPGQVNISGVIGDSALLWPSLDRDFFQVRLTEGDRLIADLDGYAIGTWLDSGLRLFDADGNEVAFSDDAAAPGESLSYDPYLEFVAPSSGNYYLGVSGFGNFNYDPMDMFSGDSGSTGAYNLSLTLETPLVSEEPNDTLTQAIPIGTELNTVGNISIDSRIGDNPAIAPELDVDMFGLQLTEGEQLTIDVDADELGSFLDAGLRLFDAYGNELAISDDNPAPGETVSLDPYLNFTAPTTGNYFISISGFPNFDYDPMVAGSGMSGSTGDYTINIAIEAPMVTPVGSTFNSIYGYGAVDAAAAVAAAIAASPFPAQPDLGGNLWGLDNVNAPEVWAQGYTGEGIVVAVLDTGVDYSHPDLDDNIWVNTGEIAGNGIDDDGNGYTDDYYGWDFVDFDNTPDDDDGHGTHVAGTIAGENDGIGITGVAFNAEIMPVRVIGDWMEQDDYEFLRDLADGIIYAAENGADVINLSLGYDPFWFPGGVLPSEADAVEDAIAYAASLGTVVVMAAGNEYADEPGYPAIYAMDWGLAIGAVDEFNMMADFTNYAGTEELDYIVAPGVNVYSTVPGSGYEIFNGTSMAAPHVAGIAALVMEANPDLSAADVEDILINTANPAGITV